MRILAVLFLFLLVGCDEAEETPAPPAPAPKIEIEVEEKKPELILTQSKFKDLPEWGSDDFKTFAQAFMRSCNRIAKNSAGKQFGVLKQAGTYGDWQKICMAFDEADKENLQEFFEEHFTPYQISADEEPIGLFTGYYEASLRGSRMQKTPYTTPLHMRPDDLVMAHLGQFREDLKGVRIAGRVKNGTLKPYESRAEIVAGKWPHEDQALLWVDNPVDAFFVQIQGSGLVQMDDGKVMRIGYAGQNGHIYYAIGRELIKTGALTKENVSMQSIRAWLEANPDQAEDIMSTNRSYVFFQEITGDGPIGAEGIALTAGRSLAVDRTLISFGLPLWVELDSPISEASKITRMMVAQDTGGAIVGPVRGDVFWGYGKIAEEMAGQMKSKGRYWALLPKSAN